MFDDDDDDDDDDDSDKHSEKTSNKKRKRDESNTRVNKQAAARRREEWVAGREEALLDDDATPDSEAAHERNVAANPTSAHAWIAYVAFQAAGGGVAASRRVIERALQTIPVQDEKARLDVWLAWLNLELAYGTKASLADAFARAVQKNDAETVHLKMAELYRANGSTREAEAAYSTMCKKFVGSLRVYLAYARFLIDEGNVAGFRKLLDRAMTALPTTQHLPIVSKFAKLEYERGSVERGRTLLEGILANHPKRLDQWYVYADMEIKHGNSTDATRRIYERMSTLKLSSKKMKGVLKRWLSFEQEHGSTAQQEHVRQIARDYVAAMTAGTE